MNKVEIVGYGKALPKEKVMVKKQTRYRVTKEETQLSLAVEAAKNALAKAACSIDDIDCIVSASAVGIQPIPCTAALIHEQIAQGTSIPALDINTTCTSFITAVDTLSYLIDAGRYHRVLIVSSEVASLGINYEDKESNELFADAAAAFILQRSENEERGIIASAQQTWSEGAHATEIRGGLSNFLPSNYSEETKEEYMFDMKGRQILSLTMKKLPQFFDTFMANNQLTIDQIDMVVPHQASRAMPFAMKHLGVPKDKFINKIKEYGNMVSASVPFVLCESLEEGMIKEGDTIILLGTAAGLTSNLLAWKV
jgi:3-oxoacyl-[acyl-carrier-protein] synthase-3